jgi:uncharacterized protein YabE (DUF348 family)
LFSIIFNDLNKYFLANLKRAITSLILGSSIVYGVGAFWIFDEEKTALSTSKKVDLYYDGSLFKVETEKDTVGQLLDEQGMDLVEEDIVFPSVDTEVFSGLIIYFKKAIEVKIEVDGKSFPKKTVYHRVSEILNDADVILSHLDRTEPARNEIISNGQKIKVIRINIEEIEKEEEIFFETQEEEDDDLKWRRKEIEREGEIGVKRVKYRITYKDGQEVSREKLSSEIIKEPVDEIIKIGTKIEVGKTKIGLASWYAHTGTMACASRMFPRGTWLRVTNRATGKQIFVVVNDYGPMRGTGKMIDLDKVAFEKIASLWQGVVEVKVEEILN